MFRQPFVNCGLLKIVLPVIGLMKLREPHLTEFRRLTLSGACHQDIHDSLWHGGYAAQASSASEEFVQREINRVALHQRSLCPLLEEFVGKVDRVLDVGCGTGGTTVAIAQSLKLKPNHITGIDPNPSALLAARQRALGSDLISDQILFQHVASDECLPFESDRFDLTVCVSVLEFVSRVCARQALVTEMIRVTKPGGFIFLATPNPYRMRNIHSRRLFGDWHRRQGFPWACTRRQLVRMVRPCVTVPVQTFVVHQAAAKLGLPYWPFPSWLSAIIALLLPWQKILVRKPG
jgi:ubiquinone/menaquinone biosynthesis C-methylase UbiE